MKIPKKTYNPCDGCEYGYSKQNQKSSICNVCEFKQYRDAEEQGLLLRLPCKVGNVVYRINKGARNPVIALVVTEIRYKALRSGKVAVEIVCSDDVMTKTNGCLVYYSEEAGKKIFFTKEEAEQTLARMEKEHG